MKSSFDYLISKIQTLEYQKERLQDKYDTLEQELKNKIEKLRIYRKRVYILGLRKCEKITLKEGLEEEYLNFIISNTTSEDCNGNINKFTAKIVELSEMLDKNEPFSEVYNASEFSEQDHPAMRIFVFKNLFYFHPKGALC